MTLRELLHNSFSHPLASGQSYSLHGAEYQLDKPISKLTEDSRQACSATLFFALKGTARDGHQYIPSVIEAGTRAIILEELPSTPHPDTLYIKVSSSHEALGLIASAWYGHPSDSLRLVGVTGTNGKTTIATLLYRLWLASGYMVGLLSTVRNYIGESSIESTHTTPGALELQALLAQMRDAGCSHVFMEVSSHAVEQRRIAGLSFDGAIFTNLTRDHLDYHGTFKAYLQAKQKFFDSLSPSAFALTNADDRNGDIMLQNTRAKRLSYALHNLADYRASVVERFADSTLISIDSKEVVVRLVGEFNIYNLLAVYATSVNLGMGANEALQQLSLLRSVDGRLETFSNSKRGYTIFVDYAHTPDALTNVLETLRNLSPKQIIVVVGCGGDRDRGKRPLMAIEASRLADKVILTSDNPRSEDPAEIIQEMKAGLSPEALSRSLSIVDRTEAIRTACMLAGKGDYILIAGKGHETYQEIKGVRYPFDDREVVRQTLEQD